MKIALICGGPSLERGISLNSARSLLDHLQSDAIQVVPFYLDYKKNAYAISNAQLYSNTPSDFDFKLQETAQALSQREFVKRLKAVDLVFPCMHGPYGEDGGIQSFLGKYKIPFVGSSSTACKAAFDKFDSNELIKAAGFYTLPSTVLKIYHTDHEAIIRDFFKTHGIKRAVVKPASGGSSIGVFSVNTPEEALERAQYLFSKRMDTRVVLEPFAQGVEFTVIILQNRFGLPVAILPTEIETDYTQNQIFDYRKKYLPTRQVTYHCPPRFNNEIIEKIQIEAEQLFSLFGMRDFARFDGWLLDNGELWFSDFNPISGMEQNSFLFQQGSRIGLSHRDVVELVVQNAWTRSGEISPCKLSLRQGEQGGSDKKPIHILFGGNTSERQVSLMSGTNVWLKLRDSHLYDPKPFLLDLDGKHVWRLPYQLALNHTVEEIVHNCEHEPEHRQRLAYLEDKVRLRLGLFNPKDSSQFFSPEKMTLEQFIDQAPSVFIGLHGGIGENGTLQHLFTQKGIPFNGPNEATCCLCMDKWETSQFLAKQNLEGVLPILGSTIETTILLHKTEAERSLFWKEQLHALDAKSLVIKPRADGCSSGIVHLSKISDFHAYCAALKTGVTSIPKGTFTHQVDEIEMPRETPKDLLLEAFVETDCIRIKGNHLKYRKITGWVEMTAGVVEHKGQLHVMNPSITIAESEVLSLEEKFQGGTGINITPPPASLINATHLEKTKTYVKAVATAIGLTGYCRIDLFVELATGRIKVIEVNSLPGLTPSTVLYHQALTETPPLYPRAFLESLVGL